MKVIGLYTTMLVHYISCYLLEDMQMGIHIGNSLLKFFLERFFTCFE
jgi:hypothetical protein